MPSLLKKLFGNRRNDDYTAGIALYNAGHYEEAIERFEAAVSGAAESSTTYRLGVFYAAEAHANIGRACLKAQHYDEARVHLEMAIEETPNFPDLQYGLGVSLFMAGQEEESLPCFQRALEINPDYVEARCFLAVALDARGKRDEARQELRSVTGRGSEIPIQVNRFLMVHLKERETLLPEVAPVLELLESGAEFRELYCEGITQFNVGNNELAADLLERVAEMKPHYADIQCQLGLARLKCGRLEGAVSALRNALTVNPRFMEAAYFLGAALLREGRYLEAEEALAYAHELGGNSTDVLFHLAQCRFHLGQHEAAGTILEELLERNPALSQARYLLGLLRHFTGRHEEALDLLREALSQNPHLSAAELDMAQIYSQRGEWGDAEAIFKRLMGENSGDATLFGFVGQAHLARGQVEEALDDFCKALELDPANLYALKGRIRSELRLGRNAKARSVLAPVLAAHADYPDLLKLSGDIHFRQGDFVAAESEYRRALSCSPHYLEAHLALALALRNQGRAGEAAELLQRLTERHPDNLELRRLLNHDFVDLNEDE